MARSSRRVVIAKTIREKELPDVAPSPADPMEKAIADVERMAGEFDPGKRAYIKVYQVIDEGKPLLALFNCAPLEAGSIEERVMACEGVAPGPGTFEARLMCDGIKKAWRFAVMVPPKKIAAGSDGPLVTVIERLTDRLERLERAPAPAAAAPSSMMDEVFKTVMMKLAEKLVEPPPAPPDPLAGMKTFGEILSMARETVGESAGGGESNVWDFLKAIGPAVAPALEQIGAAIAEQRAMRLGQVPPAALPAPNAQVASNGAQAMSLPPVVAPALNDPAFPKWLEYQLGVFMVRAARGDDVELSADQVLSDWPEDFINLVLSQADPVGQLVVAVPAVAPHKVWFEGLISSVKQAMGPETGTEGNDAPASLSDRTAKAA